MSAEPEPPLELVLDYILEMLDIIACKAIDRRTADDVAAFRIRLRQVGVRAELIQRLIDAREPIKPKVFRQ